MYGLPQQEGDVVGAAFGVVGEGFGLHAVLRPEAVDGQEDGDVGLHVGILEYGTHAAAVFVEEVEVGPPGVLLVEVAAVLHPAGEACLGGRVVEAMPYGVGDAADGAHVAAQFEQFEGGLEHAVGVGHLLGADESAATLVGGRGDQLVDHGVGAAAAVVAVGHFLADAVAQVVGGPAFALGDVVGGGAEEGEESPTVGLSA